MIAWIRRFKAGGQGARALLAHTRSLLANHTTITRSKKFKNEFDRVGRTGQLPGRRASRDVHAATTTSGLNSIYAMTQGSPLCGQPWAEGYKTFGNCFNFAAQTNKTN